MWYILFWLVGAVMGASACLFIILINALHGYFYMEPADDEKTGFYKINIRVTPEGPNSVHKRLIILYKEDSPK